MVGRLVSTGVRGLGVANGALTLGVGAGGAGVGVGGTKDAGLKAERAVAGWGVVAGFITADELG